MPLTIFISHSTNKGPDDTDELVTEEHREFLLDLRDRLNNYTDENGEKPFQVQVDIDLLKWNDPWRKKLIDGLGTCGAGMVLLNKKAITASKWVLTEANILRWRSWREKDFRLALVLLGDNSSDAFQATGAWKPLAFSEVQFLGRGQQFTGPALPEAVFKELVDGLPRQNEDAPMTRFQNLELKLTQALKAALSEDGREYAAAEARRLMEEGPKGLHGLLDRLDPYIVAEKWRGVVEAIACWWIDPRSSAPLANCGDPGGSSRSYSLTGRKVGYTPKLYARHASFKTWQTSWKVADRITASGGQQGGPEFRKAVVGEVGADLKRIYKTARPDKLPEQITDDDVKELLRNYRGRNPPVPTFVALPNHIATDVYVREAILTAFPGVSFLHLASDAAAARSIPNCLPLEPLPEIDAESEAYSDYTTALGRVGN